MSASAAPSTGWTTTPLGPGRGHHERHHRRGRREECCDRPPAPARELARGAHPPPRRAPLRVATVSPPVEIVSPPVGTVSPGELVAGRHAGLTHPEAESLRPAAPVELQAQAVASGLQHAGLRARHRAALAPPEQLHPRAAREPEGHDQRAAAQLRADLAQQRRQTAGDRGRRLLLDLDGRRLEQLGVVDRRRVRDELLGRLVRPEGDRARERRVGVARVHRAVGVVEHPPGRRHHPALVGTGEGDLLGRSAPGPAAGSVVTVAVPSRVEQRDARDGAGLRPPPRTAPRPPRPSWCPAPRRRRRSGRWSRTARFGNATSRQLRAVQEGGHRQAREDAALRRRRARTSRRRRRPRSADRRRRARAARSRPRGTPSSGATVNGSLVKVRPRSCGSGAARGSGSERSSWPLRSPGDLPIRTVSKIVPPTCASRSDTPRPCGA